MLFKIKQKSTTIMATTITIFEIKLEKQQQQKTCSKKIDLFIDMENKFKSKKNLCVYVLNKQREVY